MQAAQRRSARPRTLQRARPRPGSLGDIERELTELNAEAVDRFLRANGIDRSRSIVIGFHGQTVLHDAPRGHDRAARRRRLLAERTGVDVVYRSARRRRRGRRARGAAGAGLPPRAGGAVPELPVGVRSTSAASPTSPGSARDGRMLAFDTGPGNALIDDWMLARTGAAHDADGALRRAARVDEDVLQALLTQQLFRACRRRSRSTATPSRLAPVEGAVAGGRRRDAHGLHRRSDRRRRASTCPREPQDLDRVRGRAQEQDA